jgi:hypothetical protein
MIDFSKKYIPLNDFYARHFKDLIAGAIDIGVDDICS